MKGYSVIVGCLICFILRRHEGWKHNYVMGLTNAQQNACVSLFNLLQASSNSRQFRHDDLGDSAGEEHWYSRIQPVGDVSEDPDDDIYEEGESSATDDNLHAESGETSWHEIAENPIQAGILDLLKSLYTQLPTGNDDKFFSPILRFAVLACLQKNGQWLPPRRITHVLAVLLFCGRLVMMALMHHRLLQDPSIRYSGYVMY
jgi:hypothetical protein